MRDPKRIPEFCNKLAEIWMKYPEFRFGQFMVNIMSATPHDPWLYEDDEMIEFIDQWMNKALHLKGE